jgi:DNA repair photolyase
MKINEISAKSILSTSQVYDYAVNPYVGCGHACRYCYAAFMKRFTGHREKWGEFVDAKMNAPVLLAKETGKKPVGRVWISGVCDPYQPVEMKYRLSRRCLEILVENAWPVTIQTKSPLVLRDMDILEKAEQAEVGFSIGTADDKIRGLLEPSAPPVKARIDALALLHARGIKTFAMIAPILPGAEGLGAALRGKVDYVLIDRLNYHYANRIYRENAMAWALEATFFSRTAEALRREFEGSGTSVRVLF